MWSAVSIGVPLSWAVMNAGRHAPGEPELPRHVRPTLPKERVPGGITAQRETTRPGRALFAFPWPPVLAPRTPMSAPQLVVVRGGLATGEPATGEAGTAGARDAIFPARASRVWAVPSAGSTSQRTPLGGDTAGFVREVGRVGRGWEPSERTLIAPCSQPKRPRRLCSSERAFTPSSPVRAPTLARGAPGRGPRPHHQALRRALRERRHHRRRRAGALRPPARP